MTLTKYILLIFLVLVYSLRAIAQIKPPGNTTNSEKLGMSERVQIDKIKAQRPFLKRKGSRPMPPNPELFKRGEIDLDLNEVAVQSPEAVEEARNLVSSWRVLTLGFTATGYVGDLNFDRTSGGSVTQFALHPGFDLSFRKDASKPLLPVFRLGYGKYSAQSDGIDPVSYEYEGNLSVITPNSYAESVLIYGEIGLRFSPFPKSLRLKPFLEAGIGGQSFFPRAQDGILLFRKRSTRAPDELEYGSFMLYFPLSGGIDFQLSTSINLQISYTLKTLGTDYLDNIGKLGTKIGNDQLHVFRIGLGFRFEDYKKGRKAYQ